MEIYQELIDFTNKKRTSSEIVTSLEEQEKEIKKKKHLIKFLDASETLNELVEKNQFNEHNIQSLVLYYFYDNSSDRNNGNMIKYHLIDKVDNILSVNHGNKRFIYSLDDYFRDLYGFDDTNINKNFTANKKISLNVNDNLAEKFLDLMLSDELKVIFHYNDLQKSLSNKVPSKKENKVKL